MFTVKLAYDKDRVEAEYNQSFFGSDYRACQGRQ